MNDWASVAGDLLSLAAATITLLTVVLHNRRDRLPRRRRKDRRSTKSTP